MATPAQNAEFLPVLAELQSQLNNLQTNVPVTDPNYAYRLKEIEKKKQELTSKINALQKKAIEQAQQTEREVNEKVDAVSKAMAA